jgi:hypothetical protein
MQSQVGGEAGREAPKTVPLASEQDDGAVCERMQADGTEPCSPRCLQGRGWAACRRRQTMGAVVRDLMLRTVYRWACHDDERWPGQAPHAGKKTGHGAREAARPSVEKSAGKRPASSARATCFLMNHDLT